MARLGFAGYEQTVGTPNVVVDGAPNAATVLTLTHWPGIPAPAGLADDLSAQMAFRYLDAGADRHGGAEVVTNNHFDQDGLASVFALTDPTTARRHRELLVDLAAAGDFATYRSRHAARLSMVVAGFADPERSPLPADALARPYPEQCALLYAELLGRLPSLLDHPDAHRELWADEDADLTASEAAIAGGRVTIEEGPDLDLAVVRLPEHLDVGGGHRFGGRWVDGLHPMAVHGATDRCCVARLQGRRYDVTHRYETWVQYRSRRLRPRVDLVGLAAELNGAEATGTTWTADDVSDLTPTLRLAPGVESSLDEERFLSLLRPHLATAPPAWDPYVVKGTS